MDNQFQKYVCMFLLDEEAEEVALIKKAPKEGRPSALDGLLNGIGGKILEGETDIDAILRKLKEEAGVSEVSLFRFASITSPNWEVVFFYDFSNSIYEAKTLKDEEVSRYYVANLEMLDLAPSVSFLVRLAISIRQRKEHFKFFEIKVS